MSLFFLLRRRLHGMGTAVLFQHLLRCHGAIGRRGRTGRRGRVGRRSWPWDRFRRGRAVGPRQHQLSWRVCGVTAKNDVVVGRPVQQCAQCADGRVWPVLAKNALVPGQSHDLHPGALCDCGQNLRQAGIVGFNGEHVVLVDNDGRPGWLLRWRLGPLRWRGWCRRRSGGLWFGGGTVFAGAFPAFSFGMGRRSARVRVFFLVRGRGPVCRVLRGVHGKGRRTGKGQKQENETALPENRAFLHFPWHCVLD